MGAGGKLAAVVVAALVCAALIGAVAGHGHDPYADKPDRKPPAPRISDEAHEPPLTPAGEPQARQVARAFLQAFLDYEVGALSPAQRRSLEQIATPALAAAMLRHPPRPVHNATPARRARLTGLSIADASDHAIQYLVGVTRGGELETFSLYLANNARKWRVARVGS
jgi:hypothetical protein